MLILAQTLSRIKITDILSLGLVKKKEYKILDQKIEVNLLGHGNQKKFMELYVIPLALIFQ